MDSTIFLVCAQKILLPLPRKSCTTILIAEILILQALILGLKILEEVGLDRELPEEAYAEQHRGNVHLQSRNRRT